MDRWKTRLTPFNRDHASTLSPQGEVDGGPGVKISCVEKGERLIFLLDEERDLGTAEDDALRAAVLQAPDDFLEHFPRGVIHLT